MTLLVLLGALQCVAVVRAQTVSPTIISPNSGTVVHEGLYVSANVSSTYELQSVQASVEGRVTNLVFSNGTWVNTLSLVGLSRGNKMLTVTATDVFGNSGQAQRSFVFDMPPNVNVVAPAQGTVARPGIHINVSAADDDPAGTALYVWQAIQDVYVGEMFAAETNSVNTNLSLGSYDGQPLTLRFDAFDSAGQRSAALRRLYVQSSSNLVEIDRVTEGFIADVQSDRILFLRTPNRTLYLQDPDTAYNLKVKSRTTGIETLVFYQTNMSIGSAFLAPQGAILVASGSPFAGYGTGYALFQSQAGTEVLHGIHGNYPMGLLVKGNFGVWGWGELGGNTPSLSRTDLQATNSSLITNATGCSDIAYDVAENGDVVFAPISGTTSHKIYRYRAGAISALANDSVNSINYPKTDGSNVYYLKLTTTNQALMLVSSSGESQLAEGSVIGSDYRINNGWIAYARSGGGQTQIWRCSSSGVNTQLTFYGTSSTLAALSPNGEVAFYNGSRLYISKGTWPPFDVAPGTPSSGLTLFWQNNRWCAVLGRSLYQLYTGTLQIVSPRIGTDNRFHFDLLAGNGKRVVTQTSTDLANWVDFATNDITDQASLEVLSPINPNVAAKYFRLRVE
jgi:hypothetical protein